MPILRKLLKGEGNLRRVSLYLEKRIPIDIDTWKLLKGQRGKTHVDAYI
jgi:hypothetical protein